MSRKGCLTACIVATIVLSFAQPVQADNACQLIATKGTGKDQAKATKNAEKNLKNMAESMKGKFKHTSTRCGQSSAGFECIASGTVCPKEKGSSGD
jgi:hypothetical protein